MLDLLTMLCNEINKIIDMGGKRGAKSFSEQ